MTLIDFLLKCPEKYDLVVDGEVRPFKSMQFSRSSMSVYVPIVKDDTIYNRMIITSEGGIFKFHSIQLKDKVTDEIEELKDITFNDEGDFASKLPTSEVATAMNIFNAYSSVKCVRSVLFPGNSNLVWAGGSKDYSLEYAVIAKCEYKPLGKKAAVALLMNIASKDMDRLTEMQKLTLSLLQKCPDLLQKEYEVTTETDIAKQIFESSALIYLYRVSCMFSKSVEFPVIINDSLWIVQENEKCSKSTIF